MKRFEDKVAVVTGAASGIGWAFAELIAAEGARVAAVDTDVPGLESLAAAVEAAGGQCMIEPGDVTDAATTREAADRVAAAWGGIDVLFTSAGISMGGKVAEIAQETWERTFAVNVTGTYLWAKAVLPHMVKAGKGSIVTVASQLAVAGGRNNAAYVASKGAVISLTKAIALDYVNEGIRANTVLPGATETPLLARSMARQEDPEAARQRSRERHPMRRFGKTEEIARAALYLASDEAAFTTGVLLPVDGGWLAG